MTKYKRLSLGYLRNIKNIEFKKIIKHNIKKNAIGVLLLGNNKDMEGILPKFSKQIIYSDNFIYFELEIIDTSYEFIYSLARKGDYNLILFMDIKEKCSNSFKKTLESKYNLTLTNKEKLDPIYYRWGSFSNTLIVYYQIIDELFIYKSAVENT